ncbi:MAG: ribonuclease R family protein [Synechococcales bacterium]|nr:ribonuclease R family protein [Synechococcales bacterium]
MEFSIAELLAHLDAEKLVAPKTLEQKLECQTDIDVKKLQIALDALERIGLLEKERGKYRRLGEDETLVEGKLRCSSKEFCFAIQDEEDTEDVYIPGRQLNGAWHGDRVFVQVTKEGSRRRSPEGEVRLILERANPSILARLEQLEDGAIRAIPLDDRLRFRVDIPALDFDLGAAMDQLLHVQITRYPLAQQPPVGRVVKLLGNDDSADDIDIVCCKHDLPRTFPDHVLAAAKALPTKLTKAELKSRMDLRDLTTITLKANSNDSADDAITLEQLEDDTWQLGIHIADVAYYVQPGTPLDRAAQKRGVSIYLGDVVLPMLPDVITDQLCSLQPGKDRPAISVLLTLSPEGEVLEYEIQPSVIQVDYQLSYDQAEAILNEETGKELKPFAPIFEMMQQLNQLSHAIKEQRRSRGAFELNLPEKIYARADGIETPEEADKFTFSKFHYDDEGALGAVVLSSSLPIHSMLVELMVLTNQIVAEHLQALELPAVYRVHPMPDLAAVQELMKLADGMGLELALVNPEEVTPQDFQNFTRQFAESNAERVLTYLLLSTLKPAFYSIEAKPHFGLALEQGYVHFTSPVRRYPDLLVHRSLHAMFEEGRDRKSARSKEGIDIRHNGCHGEITWNVLPDKLHQELESHFASVVNHLSEREKVAQDSENDLEGLKKAELMKERTGEIFHGVITGVQSYGLFVEIEELLVEGLVHVSSLKDDWYEFRSRQQTLVGRKNRKQFRLGDRIEVQVKSVDYYRQQIDLVAVSGGSQASEDYFAAPDDEDEENGLDDFDSDDE